MTCKDCEEEQLSTQGEWLVFGIEHGFCSVPACITHDTVEMSQEETDQFEDGYDPCIHAVRLWLQPEEAAS